MTAAKQVCAERNSANSDGEEENQCADDEQEGNSEHHTTSSEDKIHLAQQESDLEQDVLALVQNW